MMREFYVLAGHLPVVADLATWEYQDQRANWRVAHDFCGRARASTVFLGIDCRSIEHGPALVFETMIFGGVHDLYRALHATWRDAVAGHAHAVELMQGALP